MSHNKLVDQWGNPMGVSVEHSIYNSPVSEELARDKIVTWELSNPEATTQNNTLHRNSYFKHLIDSYHQSATNGACIDAISDFIYGFGLAIKGKDGEPISEGAGNTKISKLNNILSAKDVKRLVFDYYLFNNVAVQVTYGDGVGNRRKIKKLTHFPVQTLCREKMGDDGVVKRVGYHPKWEKYEPRDKIKWIPIFGSQVDDDGKPVPNQSNTEMAILQPYCPGSWYFTQPGWSRSGDYAVLESNISEFQINDIQTGFSGTTLINVQRNVTNTDKRDYFKEELANKVSGLGGNRTMVFFNKDEREKVEMERFPLSDAPGHYEYLANESSRKILTAHRITNPKILSVPTTGEQGLGNNADELETAAEMLQNLVIGPKQTEIIEWLKELLDVNKFSEELMFINRPILSEDFYSKKLERQASTLEVENKFNAPDGKTLDDKKPKDKGKSNKDTNNVKNTVKDAK